MILSGNRNFAPAIAPGNNLGWNGTHRALVLNCIAGNSLGHRRPRDSVLRPKRRASRYDESRRASGANGMQARSPLGDVESAKLVGLPHRIAEFDANGWIMAEGDRVTHCHVVLSGYAYCHKVTGDGARQIVSVHMRGDTVNLCGLALDTAGYNIQTLTRSTVAYIPRAALMELVWEYPKIGAALMAEIAINASLLGEWLVGVGRRDARGRICHLLCEIAARQEDAGICQGPDYEWPMTQEQIGDATGLTSVHVNRTLQQLRSEGYFRTTRRRVTVNDWRRLWEIGDLGSSGLPLPTPCNGEARAQSW